MRRGAGDGVAIGLIAVRRRDEAFLAANIVGEEWSRGVCVIYIVVRDVDERKTQALAMPV